MGEHPPPRPSGTSPRLYFGQGLTGCLVIIVQPRGLGCFTKLFRVSVFFRCTFLMNSLKIISLHLTRLWFQFQAALHIIVVV